MDDKKLYNMALHEECHISDGLTVIRVPNGWLYKRYYKPFGSDSVQSMCFVPYHDEFKPEPHEKKISEMKIGGTVYFHEDKKIKEISFPIERGKYEVVKNNEELCIKVKNKDSTHHIPLKTFLD